MSKLLAAIIALYEIIKLATKFTQTSYKKIYDEKIEQAAEKVVKEKDQRDLEKVTFKDSGEPSKKRYFGMRVVDKDGKDV